jgi:hypothetical protein
MTEQHINDPITTTAKKLREKISSSSRSLGWQVASVRRSLHPHREHTVLRQAINPARHMMTQKQSLPKELWVSATGAYLVDALALMITFDQDVHTQNNAIAALDAELLLLEKLDGTGSAEDAEALKVMTTELDDQLLINLRAEVIAELQALLRDPDPSIAAKREAIRDLLIGFIEEQIELAVTEAGYHVVPDMKSMHPGDMLRHAQALIEEIKTRLDEPQTAQVGLSRREHTRISVNLNRALSLALLSFPQFAAKKAQHVPGSTIDGRITFLLACTGALEQASGVGSTQDAVAYRMHHAHKRILADVQRRIEYFRSDLELASRNIKRSADVVAQAKNLQLALAKIYCRR